MPLTFARLQSQSPLHLASVDAPDSQGLDQSPSGRRRPEVRGSSAHPSVAVPLTSLFPHVWDGLPGSLSPAFLLQQEPPLGEVRACLPVPGDWPLSAPATGGVESPNCLQPSGRARV